MGVIIDETKNPVLMEWRRKAVAEGKVEAKAEFLQIVLKQRFGPLPKWRSRMCSEAGRRGSCVRS